MVCYVRKAGLLCVWVELVISRQDLLGSTVGCLSRNLHSNYSQWCHLSSEGGGMSIPKSSLLQPKFYWEGGTPNRQLSWNYELNQKGLTSKSPPMSDKA